MRRVIIAVERVLNMIKGFEVGYTSRVDNKIMMDFEGSRYVVTFRKLENPSESMIDDIDRFL
jgi:hypothetical protein